MMTATGVCRRKTLLCYYLVLFITARSCQNHADAFLHNNNGNGVNLGVHRIQEPNVNSRSLQTLQLSSTTPDIFIHHTAIKTRNITNAIDFYSLLGFQVSTKFRAGPAKAAWLELTAAADSAACCRLELIEVPEYILQEPEGMKRRAVDLMQQQQLLGHNHLALDVTQQVLALGEGPKNGTDSDATTTTSSNLTTWLQALNQTSFDKWKRTLRIALEPRQQMIGQGVYELAFLYDADGALIELLNKQTELTQTIDSGWEPWVGSEFQQS